jgi:ParB family transcriptional regulator, chromosome partitioning protein
MSRKDTLRALLTARERKLPIGNSDNADILPNPPIPSKHLVKSGAVGAMGRSLGKIASAAEEARALMGSGAAVVELNPELIESSFLADRLNGDNEDHASLVESIRDHGQQVPILVRPHPSQTGKFQVAYGHRRLRAVAALGRNVRAVVRDMDDAALVVAQGQENSSRLDLSYIEKALFAVTIEDRGFDRSVLMAALSLEKTQLSRLISIGRAIPIEVIKAVGPAPKTGRPRWAALVDVLQSSDWEAVLDKLKRDPEFTSADSDSRFGQLERAFNTRKSDTITERWSIPDGSPAASIKRTESRLTLTVDQRVVPDFGEYIVRELPDLYRRYAAERERA